MCLRCFRRPLMVVLNSSQSTACCWEHIGWPGKSWRYRIWCNISSGAVEASLSLQSRYSYPNASWKSLRETSFSEYKNAWTPHHIASFPPWPEAGHTEKAIGIVAKNEAFWPCPKVCPDCTDFVSKWLCGWELFGFPSSYLLRCGSHVTPSHSYPADLWLSSQFH